MKFFVLIIAGRYIVQITKLFVMICFFQNQFVKMKRSEVQDLVPNKSRLNFHSDCHYLI